MHLRTLDALNEFLPETANDRPDNDPHMRCSACFVEFLHTAELNASIPSNIEEDFIANMELQTSYLTLLAEALYDADMSLPANQQLRDDAGAILEHMPQPFKNKAFAAAVAKHMELNNSQMSTPNFGTFADSASATSTEFDIDAVCARIAAGVSPEEEKAISLRLDALITGCSWQECVAREEVFGRNKVSATTKAILLTLSS